MSCTQPFGQFERKFHFRSRTRQDRLTHFFECLCPLVLQLTRCLGDSFLCLRDLLLSRLRSFVQLGLITRHCVAPHFARNPGPATNLSKRSTESLSKRFTDSQVSGESSVHIISFANHLDSHIMKKSRQSTF